MQWIRWFDELTIADVPRVGGKNASLGEMIRELKPKGIQIPDGFAITADAFGICGQAPSAYPEFAAFLVEHGIDSISLILDAVLRTTADILEIEKAVLVAPA